MRRQRTPRGLFRVAVTLGALLALGLGCGTESRPAPPRSRVVSAGAGAAGPTQTQASRAEGPGSDVPDASLAPARRTAVDVAARTPVVPRAAPTFPGDSHTVVHHRDATRTGWGAWLPGPCVNPLAHARRFLQSEARAERAARHAADSHAVAGDEAPGASSGEPAPAAAAMPSASGAPPSLSGLDTLDLDHDGVPDWAVRVDAEPPRTLLYASRGRCGHYVGSVPGVDPRPGRNGPALVDVLTTAPCRSSCCAELPEYRSTYRFGAYRQAGRGKRRERCPDS